MSVSLDPAVADKLDEGDVLILPLVRFDLPGKTVGYHIGGRPFTWGGLTYQPNRWLSPGSFENALGNAVTARTLVFSNVPTDNPDDAIARIEEYAYLNAPVTITYLIGDPETDEPIGILANHFYEINDVEFEKGEIGKDGLRTVTLKVEIEPPGRRVRDQTYARRSQDEQQFDNDPTDTGLEHAATQAEWPEEWGQTQG